MGLRAMRLSQLKEFLMEHLSYGYDLVITRKGVVRVFVHRSELERCRDLLREHCANVVEVKPFSRFWELRMWWRQL